jgi:DNA-binding transcriptional MocR family regulator
MAFLYQQIAEELGTKIQNGEFNFDQKIPSVRAMAQKMNCSHSVVIQAYESLEKNGLIYAVPKSGYFPQIQNQILAVSDLQVKKSPNKLKAIAPSTNLMIAKVLEASLNPQIAPLGGGIPSPEILPLQTLQKFLVRASRDWTELLGMYTPTLGSLNLRKQIAKLMHQRGVEVDPEEILITNGCMEALVLALRACTQKGDVVALEYPLFFGLISVLEDLELKVVQIKTHPQTGLDLEHFKKALEKHSIRVLVSSATLQNPLGFSTSSEHKKSLVELCKKNKVTLIEDDVYGECLFQPELIRPLKHYDQSQNVIYCSSFSKTTCPGYRIGWMIAGKNHTQVTRAKMSQTLGGSSLIQEAMALFLEEGSYEYHIKKFRKAIASQVFQYRQLILDTFPKNTKVSSPQGGFFLWVELPEDLQINTAKLFDRAILECGVSFVPGPTFCAEWSDNHQPLHPLNSCLRISCGAPLTPEIKAKVLALGQFFDSQK